MNRSEALDFIQSVRENFCKHEADVQRDFDELAAIVQDAPEHGEWITSDTEVALLCSQCGCHMPYVKEMAGKDLPRCPKCFAIMDGQKEGKDDA